MGESPRQCARESRKASTQPVFMEMSQRGLRERIRRSKASECVERCTHKPGLAQTARATRSVQGEPPDEEIEVRARSLGKVRERERRSMSDEMGVCIVRVGKDNGGVVEALVFSSAFEKAAGRHAVVAGREKTAVEVEHDGHGRQNQSDLVMPGVAAHDVEAGAHENAH